MCSSDLPTVIGFIQRLENKGFVTSSVSPRDRRCRVIRLTEKFDEVQRVMRETRDTIDERVTRGFTDEEIAQLENYLSRVYHNISES